jgi:hypothetical protein
LALQPTANTQRSPNSQIPNRKSATNPRWHSGSGARRSALYSTSTDPLHRHRSSGHRRAAASTALASRHGTSARGGRAAGPHAARPCARPKTVTTRGLASRQLAIIRRPSSSPQAKSLAVGQHPCPSRCHGCCCCLSDMLRREMATLLCGSFIRIYTFSHMRSGFKRD